MDQLARIRRLIIRGDYRFTLKASNERDRDGLTTEDVIEVLLYGTLVKKMRSTSVHRAAREYAFIIQGFTFDNLFVYTKGVIKKENGRDIYYLLVSAKRSILG